MTSCEQRPLTAYRLPRSKAQIKAHDIRRVLVWEGCASSSSA